MEFETAIAWGIDLDRWHSISAIRQSQMMAHFLHRNIREGYLSEWISKKSSKGGKNKNEGVSLDELMRTVNFKV